MKAIILLPKPLDNSVNDFVFVSFVVVASGLFPHKNTLASYEGLRDYLFSISEKSISFLRWLQSLAPYLRNARK